MPSASNSRTGRRTRWDLPWVSDDGSGRADGRSPRQHKINAEFDELPTLPMDVGHAFFPLMDMPEGRGDLCLVLLLSCR